ncbi:MAG: hypothetical protein ACREXT_13790 [Gammaproteobacteria bacterium]
MSKNTINSLVVLALLPVALGPAAAEAASMYEVLTGPYDLANPPTPVSNGGVMRYRFVPLCNDGSGDHEWSRGVGNAGIAPTCAAEDYIRCIDGTRPTYYLDKARTADNSADAESNHWAFWFQGGGSCSDSEALGAGETCWNAYNDPGEVDEMTSSDDPMVANVSRCSARRSQPGGYDAIAKRSTPFGIADYFACGDSPRRGESSAKHPSAGGLGVSGHR